MTAGVPDGWTTWRHDWRTSELADPGNSAALLTAATRMAERQGLEVMETARSIRQQGETTTIVLTVRPRGSERSASFRE